MFTSFTKSRVYIEAISKIEFRELRNFPLRKFLSMSTSAEEGNSWASSAMIAWIASSECSVLSFEKNVPLLKESIILSITRVVFGPFIAFIIIHNFDLSGFAAGVLLIQSAMPSAMPSEMPRAMPRTMPISMKKIIHRRKQKRITKQYTSQKQKIKFSTILICYGAGSENRTRVISLEG